MSVFLRVVSIAVLVATPALFVLQLDPQSGERLELSELAEAGVLLLLGLSAALLLWRGSHDTGFDARIDADAMGPLAVQQFALIQDQMTAIAARLDRIELDLRTLPSAGATRAGDLLSELRKELSELRAVSMLPESERRRHHARFIAEHRAALIADVHAALDAGDFAAADRALAALPLEPVDPAVDALRQRLAEARTRVRAERLEQARSEIESLAATSRWDEAMHVVEQLAGDFPGDPEVLAVLARVRRERQVARHALGERLYQQIKTDSEKRQWRSARTAADRLLREVPDHPRARRVRAMIDTLIENAEIEERQEREDRIQELIRARKLDEAIALAEQLIADYPTSPQARSLQMLLPELRARANGP
ncbi:MAG TPA: hypothetical protein PKB10_09300 [Tepidisphaeraceae bacterium]|nr:hypothetical protein [Tepidisphaeraceae bacterium]